MAEHPLLEEKAHGAETGNPSAHSLISATSKEYTAQADIPRKLDIYAASAGYELRDELDFLSKRTIEANIFFNARFLAPAMPRLEDRTIRFMVMRDENEERSRLRFVMPYTVESLGWWSGQAMLGAWTTIFSPQGTPLIDQDDPSGVIDDLLDILGREHLGLPQVMLFPDMRRNGAASKTIREAAAKRHLPVISLETRPRRFLASQLSGDAYLKQALTSADAAHLQQLTHDLSELGDIHYSVCTNIDDIRLKFERFILLENRTAKVKQKTKIVSDRYREAFAREAVNNLAERGAVQFHALELNDKVIAALIVFVENDNAWLWQSACADNLRGLSPDTLLLQEVIRHMLDDPQIKRVDSCLLQDHPLVETLFNVSEPQETLAIGLNSEARLLVEKAVKRLKLHSQRNRLTASLCKYFRFMKDS